MFFQWKYSGMVLGIFSSIFVSLGATLVSYLKDFHPYAKSSFRFVSIVVLAFAILLYYWLRKQKSQLLENLWPLGKASAFNILLLVLRSLLGCSAGLLQYSSLQYMNLADSAVVTCSSPVLVSFLAYLFLGEPFGVVGLLSMLIALSGIVFIIRPPFLTGVSMDLDLTVGVSLAFTSILLRSIATVIVRYLNLNDIHYSVVLFVFGSFGMVQSLTMALSYEVMTLPTTPIDISLVIAIGVLSCLAQIFSILALKAEKAGPITLIRTIGVFLAFVWQTVVLKKYPDYYSIIGGVIVTTGVVLTAFKNCIDSGCDSLPKTIV